MSGIRPDPSRADRRGNSPDATRRNAGLEGVAGRTGIVTGDMTRLPFADTTSGPVISNWAVHNVSSAEGRQSVRVLRPGWRLAIAEVPHTNRHRAHLGELGLFGVQRRKPGWQRGWAPPSSHETRHSDRTIQGSGTRWSARQCWSSRRRNR